MSDATPTNVKIYNDEHGVNLFITLGDSQYKMIFKSQVQYFEITFIKFDINSGEELYNIMFYHGNGDENYEFLKQLLQVATSSSVKNIFNENIVFENQAKNDNAVKYILKNDFDNFEYALLQIYIHPMGMYLASIQGREHDKSEKLNEYIDLYKILIKSNKWFGVLIKLKGLSGSQARYKHSLIF